MTSTYAAGILDLPNELLLNVYHHLPADSLAALAATSRQLRSPAYDSALWRHKIQEHVSYTLPLDPPCTSENGKQEAKSWFELYKTLHPYWFLTRQQLWLSDEQPAGGLFFAHYNLHKHTISLYKLCPYSKNQEQDGLVEQWERDPSVLIRQSELSAAVESIVLELHGNVDETTNEQEKKTRDRVRSWSAAPSDAEVVFARDLPARAIDPGTSVWPPLTIPAAGRVRVYGWRDSPSVEYRNPVYSPAKSAMRSKNAFRLYRNESRAHPQFANTDTAETLGALPAADELVPSEDKPFRGVWMGGCNGHGNQFIAFLQPDEPIKLPHNCVTTLDQISWFDDPAHASPSLSTSSGGSDYMSAVSYEEPPAPPPSKYSGQLLGVKLTGDSNVPRGAYTFIIPDLGQTLRIADEQPFKDAEVVGGVGHIAGFGYRFDEYIPAQVVLVSPNRIAMYWEALGHISYFDRVNLDAFTKWNGAKIDNMLEGSEMGPG